MEELETAADVVRRKQKEKTAGVKTEESSIFPLLILLAKLSPSPVAWGSDDYKVRQIFSFIFHPNISKSCSASRLT